MLSNRVAAIPIFRLYGEAAEVAVPNFVHAEKIGTSAPLHGWEISAHRHDHLSQALLITEGHGRFRIDAHGGPLVAPWLMWIPTSTVHAFSFDPGIEGIVLSLSDDFLASAIAADHAMPRLDAAASAAFSGPPGTRDEIDLDLCATFSDLGRELCGSQPEAVSAAAALVKLLLVGLARTRSIRSITEPAVAARADLYRRFRRLTETHLRENWPVFRFAADLGVSPDRLHAACTEMAGKAPQAILHDRQMLEAKRSLIYTTSPVSKIGFDLGFNDPAYFSRFFRSRAGLSPAAYRKAHRLGSEANRLS